MNAFLVSLLLIASPCAQVKDVPRTQAIPLPHDQVSLQFENKELARLHFDKNLRRPFLYPIVGPSGISLTRMGHPHDPVSHSHHNSVWLSHHDINGVDFWGDQTKGRIVHQRVEKLTDADADASVTTLNHWIDESTKTTLLVERRRITATPCGINQLLLTIDSQFEAKVDVAIGKTPFGFIGVRMAKSIGVRDGGGTILNSEGGVNEKGAFWKPAKWVDYSGPIKTGVVEGVALFDHPANPNHPSIFHVRDDGWMGASFSHAAAFPLTKGKSLRLRYGLYIHETPTRDAIEARWRAFAKTEADDLTPKKMK